MAKINGATLMARSLKQQGGWPHVSHTKPTPYPALIKPAPPNHQGNQRLRALNSANRAKEPTPIHTRL